MEPTALSEARLRTDLTAALKAKDTQTVSTLRLALTALSTAQVAGKAARALTADDVERVLHAEHKRRIDAAEAYDAVGATERAASERAEAEILERYLPTPLTDAELDRIVAAVLAAPDAPDTLGPVIKAVRAQVGTRADGGRVAQAVRAALDT